MSNEQRSQAGNSNKNNQEFRQFVESNQSYLEEKYHEIFTQSNDEENPFIKLTDIPVDSLLSYIYEIFSLQKYEANPKVHNAIKASIQENLKEFLMELDPNKLSKSNKLTFEKLTEILIFIVERNSIFSIQYETKNHSSSQKTQKNKNSNTPFQVDIVINEGQDDVIDDDFGAGENKKSNKKLNSFSLQNEFDSPNNFDNTANQLNTQKLIKKNARAFFDFYCRQQMQLGGVITFDRLSEQTSSMSLGKCLTFAKATNLYSALIRRQDLVTKFKKVSEGKKYINFEKFQAMIGEFQVMDPNFNQRIGLLSEDIRKVLKYVKLPFNTKDTQPRQKVAVRNFSSKLTQHSGQSSEELKIQLQQKKQEINNLRKMKQIKEYLEWKQSRPELIKQNDLKSTRAPKKKDLTVELSFIGSIIHPQEEDQTYLKDHMIPKLEKQTQKIQKFAKVFETDRYQSLDKLTLRKQSVISDIRKRIKQIQSSENISLSKQLQRSHLLSPKNKYLQS